MCQLLQSCNVVASRLLGVDFVAGEMTVNRRDWFWMGLQLSGRAYKQNRGSKETDNETYVISLQ